MRKLINSARDREFTVAAVKTLVVSIVFMSVITAAAFAVAAKTQRDRGEAVATIQGDSFSLSNAAIAIDWRISGGRFSAIRLRDKLTGQRLSLPDDAFSLILQGGGVIKPSAMKIVGGPTIEKVGGGTAVPASRHPSQQIVLKLEDPESHANVIWRGILTDRSTYIRQEVAIQAKSKDLNIASIRLIDLRLPGAQVSGMVKGSPIVSGNMFFAFEHPLCDSRVMGDRAIAALARVLPLKAGQSVTYSSVMGVTAPGQLRRGFLRYIERERAHPYRTFLHYNSWYDLGYFNKYDEAGAVQVIEAFGTELTKKRGVKLDSFLFDDGWDDAATLWHFHSGFPNGFRLVRQVAAKYDAAPGIWFSPWGGYGDPREERLKFGKASGFETNETGFALSGPKYYERFRDTTLGMIRDYGVNQFKIDGTGNADQTVEGSKFDSDFDAAIHLIGEMRAESPDIYVNLTTGTYPSPFWLRYADSIWRGGEDHSFAGVGSNRQKWITYRDADTYAGIVMSGPLFPLNSVMLHGMIYARHAHNLDSDPNDDFASEVRSYFGTGTQLQEMYITPALLSDANWDTLAEAAKWSRGNASVLQDTHWVGGDPTELEVYGWASWSPEKGILTLRNPSDAAQDFAVDVRKIFELPAGAPQVYKAHSPWHQDADAVAILLRAKHPHTFHLAPFQVVNLEFVPQK